MVRPTWSGRRGCGAAGRPGQYARCGGRLFVGWCPAFAPPALPAIKNPNQTRGDRLMKLYCAPGACSIGIHVLLEEIGKPYEAVPVNLREGDEYKPGFTSVNPKSKVPTLVRDDGSVLTEFPAIAYYLARSNPYANLLPDDIDQQARALELLDYAVATIHMQGFTRQFRPANFTPSAADEETVKARGKEIAEKGFALLDKALAGKDYAVGK